MPHNNRLALQSGTSMESQRGTTYVELMKTRPPVFAVRRVAEDAIDAVHVHGGSPYGRGVEKSCGRSRQLARILHLSSGSDGRLSPWIILVTQPVPCRLA